MRLTRAQLALAGLLGGMVLVVLSPPPGQGGPNGKLGLPARDALAQMHSDESAARSVGLDVSLQRKTSAAGRWLTMELPRVAAAEEWLAHKLGGPDVDALTFTSVRDGRAVRVHCLVLTPPGADDQVTVYLASSGARRGPIMDVEALAIYRCFDQPRRLLMVPLPAEEQRGPGWPAIATADLASLLSMARQSDLDLVRAADCCAAQGWRVTGLAGYSLGGCLMARFAAARSDRFAGAELHLWGSGGDLRQLIATSKHPLAKAISLQPGQDADAWARNLTMLDATSFAPVARLSGAWLVGGEADDVIPKGCVLAEGKALTEAGIPVTYAWTAGGHTSVIGVPQPIERLLRW